MARPRKDIKRDQQLNFSLTVHELATLYERAARAGMSLMSYGRWRLLGEDRQSALSAAAAPKADRRLLLELSRLGNLLNQLVRLFHREKQNPPEALPSLLEKIRRLINRELADDR